MTARIYPFEVVSVASFAVTLLLLWRHDLTLSLDLFWALARETLLALAAALGIGFVVWLLHSLIRRKGRELLRRQVRRRKVLLLARIVLSAVLVAQCYEWIKIYLPILNGRLLDSQLWEIDRALLLGMSPNVLFLYLFQSPGALGLLDATYQPLFGLALVLSVALGITHPAPRIQIAWANGAAVLWAFGAWLYLLVPSLGPCYVFPDIWVPFAEHLESNLQTQALLHGNYQRVLALRDGAQGVAFSVTLGVAAFPSLHVASQVFAALWAQQAHRWLGLLTWASVGVVFVGSIVTGWHYGVDSVAGALLGWMAFALGGRRLRLRRFCGGHG